MGTKENFNQAMHEVFPFYKNAKVPDAGTELNSSALARQNCTDENETDFDEQAVTARAVKKALDFKSFSMRQENPEIETTTITKDTKITGKITTRSNIDISGDILGDVESQHTIKLSGKVEGNLTGNDIEINSATIKGNIQASEKLSVMDNSNIIGNIISNDLEFDGKISGNINVKKGVSIQKDSNIVGDITAMSIEIEKGASIKGMLTITGEKTESTESAPIQL